MKRRYKTWSEEELKRLAEIVAAGGSPVRAAAALQRRIASCQNQARKMGMPFKSVLITRKAIRERCAAAERELARG